MSNALYKHQLNRLRIMVRGCVIGLIHEKTLHMDGGTYESGKSVSLMSTDVPGIETAAEMFHETWAMSVEAIAGIILLAWQVGRLWPLPLFLVLCGRYPYISG